MHNVSSIIRYAKFLDGKKTMTSDKKPLKEYNKIRKKVSSLMKKK